MGPRARAHGPAHPALHLSARACRPGPRVRAHGPMILSDFMMLSRMSVYAGVFVIIYLLCINYVCMCILILYDSLYDFNMIYYIMLKSFLNYVYMAFI